MSNEYFAENVLMSEDSLGWLMYIVFNDKFPAGDTFILRATYEAEEKTRVDRLGTLLQLQSHPSLQGLWQIRILVPDNDDTEKFFAARLEEVTDRLKRNLSILATSAIHSGAGGSSSKSTFEKHSKAEKERIEASRRDIGDKKVLTEKEATILIQRVPKLSEFLTVELTSTSEQRARIREYLFDYAQRFMNKELIGQERQPLPRFFSNALREQLYSPQRRSLYGDTNLAIDDRSFELFCHGLLCLIYQNIIVLRRIFKEAIPSGFYGQKKTRYSDATLTGQPVLSWNAIVDLNVLSKEQDQVLPHLVKNDLVFFERKIEISGDTERTFLQLLLDNLGSIVYPEQFCKAENDDYNYYVREKKLSQLGDKLEQRFKAIRKKVEKDSIIFSFLIFARQSSGFGIFLDSQRYKKVITTVGENVSTPIQK